MTLRDRVAVPIVIGGLAVAALVWPWPHVIKPKYDDVELLRGYVCVPPHIEVLSICTDESGIRWAPRIHGDLLFCDGNDRRRAEADLAEIKNP